MFPTFAARARCAGMKTTIALATLVAVALVPATAEAKRGQGAAGELHARRLDGDYVTGKFGKAHLVDGKRNDKLSVHVRRLAKRTTYTFKLQTGSCGGAEVTGWRYRALKTSRKGVGNSWARSRTFKAAKGTKYFVAVYGPDGQMVVCARLSSKGHSHPHKRHGQDDDQRVTGTTSPRQATTTPEARARTSPAAAATTPPATPRTRTAGKSEEAPGRAKDKHRGKSDDAPGRKKPRR